MFAKRCSVRIQIGGTQTNFPIDYVNWLHNKQQQGSDFKPSQSSDTSSGTYASLYDQDLKNIDGSRSHMGTRRPTISLSSKTWSRSSSIDVNLTRAVASVPITRRPGSLSSSFKLSCWGLRYTLRTSINIPCCSSIIWLENHDFNN